MSFLNKNYAFVKQENFEVFLKFFGVPAEGIEKLVKFNPDQKLVKDGDTYTYITATLEGPKEVKFKSGVEFDDLMGSAKIPAKTTFVVDGNTVTQTIKLPQGTVTFKREYIGDDLIITNTMDTWDGVAKSFYKAVK